MLKLKTAEFHIITRSHTPPLPPRDEAEFVEIALALRARVDLPPRTRYRLAGVGMSGFTDELALAAQTGDLFIA